MVKMNKSQKILKGLDCIRTYIGGESPIARDKVVEFIKSGMPAAQLCGKTWYAHADLIDEWFRKRTNLSYQNAPDQFFDDSE